MGRFAQRFDCAIERSMAQRNDTPANSRPEWQKPELVRLGTLRDIAQPGANLDQGNAGKGVPVAS